MIDQCPSSKHESSDEHADVRASTGRVYWRSLDELAGSEEFKSFLHREFPAYASELLSGSRRQFLKVMGASFALAGAATLPGCRRPDHRILAYHQDPEHIIPGVPLFYATTLPTPGGGAVGMLAETHEGRPTKLEGNPLHPASKGKSTSQMQAMVLGLYDPDRDPKEIERFRKDHEGTTTGVTDWSALETFVSGAAPELDAKRGAGLSFLVDKTTSPTRDRLRAQVLARWPQARWYVYEAIDNANANEGSLLAFGDVYKQHLSLEKAQVVLSLDSDFLGGEGSSIATERGFAASRYVAGSSAGHSASDSRMNRLYVLESGMTLTGGQADHRIPLKPSQLRAAAFKIGAALLARTSGTSALSGAISQASAQMNAEGVSDAWVNAVVDDLVRAGNAGVVVAGPSQPAEVHALAHAINAALGSVGNVVRFTQIEGDAAESSVDSITELTSEINAGSVDTLVVLGCNPVYTAPADLAFAEAYAKVPNRIQCGTYDETAAASTMHIAGAHALERWGDVVDWDGTYSVTQPMIKPLFDGKADIEVLALFAGEADTDPYTQVRSTLSQRAGVAGDSQQFESMWRRTLHDGLLAGSGNAFVDPALRANQIIASLGSMPAFGGGEIEAVFIASSRVHDGRYANNGWLQELPDPQTRIAWDAPALVSIGTAKALGIPTKRKIKGPQYSYGKMIDVTIDGRTVRVPVTIHPGVAEGTIILTCGYGRTVSGRVGAGTGVDVYPARSSSAMRVGSASVTNVGGDGAHLLANTQDHWAMEGREPIREIDLPRWQKFGDLDWMAKKELQVDHYDHTRNLNFAGLLGMESHTPAPTSIYTKAQQHHYVQMGPDGKPLRDENGNVVPIKSKFGRREQQWGMSIDLTTCNGCGACTTACQAENNIPIVGKMEVAKGREMHWIRVDRYFMSTLEEDAWGVDPADDPNPDMMFQPVPCMQCENAPCEVVCPVNATTHGERGLNDMAYNRCIGTRYCSNNCPYKVRRFNYFDYATKEFQGGYGQLANELADKNVPIPENQNWVPPRLREPKSKVGQMQYNPNVTVRSRGVMEKCTYCVQRINRARVETRLEDLTMIPDGFFQVACQQACPSDAITFGDIYDFDANDGKGSRMTQLRNDPRSYQLLAYLNNRTRTTYMLRIKNPNPTLVSDARKAVWEEPPGHHGHGDGHGHDDHGHGDHDSHSDAGRIMGLPILNNAGVLA